MMKVGLQIPQFQPSTPETMRGWLTEVAQAADEGGFDSLWVMDHFFQLGGWLGEAETEMVEGYTTLGFLAGVTQKIHIGLLVGGVIYRHPALVIKIVSTLDVLSRGRAYFGIGAAWYEHETVSLGMRFPPKKERFERLEDILRLAHHMWSGDTSAFVGTHVQVPYPVNNPQPLTKPHPPILIGGMGPTKTLRFVAQYADACNFFGGRPEEEIKRSLEILEKHSQDVGRSFDEIEKTVLQTIDMEGDPQPDPVARGKQLQEWGFQHIIFNIKGFYDARTMDYLTKEVIPALKQM
jgi:F420-dependent oxidoreductase-like protein